MHTRAIAHRKDRLMSQHQPIIVQLHNGKARTSNIYTNAMLVLKAVA
jgi:hypothetical protein